MKVGWLPDSAHVPRSRKVKMAPFMYILPQFISVIKSGDSQPLGPTSKLQLSSLGAALRRLYFHGPLMQTAWTRLCNLQPRELRVPSRLTFSGSMPEAH